MFFKKLLNERSFFKGLAQEVSFLYSSHKNAKICGSSLIVNQCFQLWVKKLLSFGKLTWWIMPKNGISTPHFEKVLKNLLNFKFCSWQHWLQHLRNECFDKKSDPVVDHDDANDIYNCKGAWDPKERFHKYRIFFFLESFFPLWQNLLSKTNWK